MRVVRSGCARWMCIGASAMLILAVATSAASASVRHAGRAARSGTDTLTVALGGLGGYQAPLYIASIEGYFRQQHLDVKLTFAGGNTLPMVIGGQADLGAIGAGVAFVPVPQGKETSIIYAETGSLEAAFFAGKAGYKTPADCKRIATSPVGTSAYDWAATYRDLSHSHADLVPIGDPAAIAGTVVSGQNDCIVNGYTTIAPALSSSFQMIYDPRNPSTLPSGIPNKHGVGVAIWGLKDHVTQLHPQLARFILALRKAEVLIRKWSPGTLTTILRRSPDWQAFDANGLTAAVGAEQTFLSPNHGYINRGAWAPELAWLNYGLPFLNPSDPTYSWQSRVDMQPYLAANKMFLATLKKHHKKRK